MLFEKTTAQCRDRAGARRHQQSVCSRSEEIKRNPLNCRLRCVVVELLKGDDGDCQCTALSMQPLTEKIRIPWFFRTISIERMSCVSVSTLCTTTRDQCRFPPRRRPIQSPVGLNEEHYEHTHTSSRNTTWWELLVNCTHRWSTATDAEQELIRALCHSVLIQERKCGVPRSRCRQSLCADSHAHPRAPHLTYEKHCVAGFRDSVARWGLSPVTRSTRPSLFQHRVFRRPLFTLRDISFVIVTRRIVPVCFCVLCV